jgi:hypothetical protein
LAFSLDPRCHGLGAENLECPELESPEIGSSSVPDLIGDVAIFALDS